MVWLQQDVHSDASIFPVLGVFIMLTTIGESKKGLMPKVSAQYPSHIMMLLPQCHSSLILCFMLAGSRLLQLVHMQPSSITW